MKLPFKFPNIKLPAIKLPKFGKKKADDEDDEDEFDFDPSDFEGDPDASLGDVPESAGEGGGLDDDAGDDFDDLDDLLETPVGGGTAEASASDTVPAAGEEQPVSEDAVSDGDVSADDLDLDLADEPEDIDFDDDQDDDEEGKSKLDPKRKKLLIIGGGATAGVLLIGGLTWFFLSGDGEAGKTADEKSDVPKVEIALAPKTEKRAKGTSLNAIAAGVQGPGEGVSVPATSPMIFASVAPPAVTDGPLKAADDPALKEEGSQGPLPKIAPDGRMPWKVYAKPFDVQDARPRVAIVVRGLGLSEAATDAAISLLPGNVTLTFDPYTPNIEDWASKARQAGHEILVTQPLEPTTFPKDDPGPQALMTTNAPDENKLRLEYVLSRMSGYIGVMTSMGSKFNQSEDHLGVFLNQLKARGLMLMDGDEEQKSLAPKLATEIGVPRAFVDIILDDVPTQSAIDAQLAELEGILARQPAAVAVISAYPYSIERVAAWTAGLEAKNLVLAPLSNLADKQFLQ